MPTVKQVATHPVAQAGAAVAAVTALSIAASFIAPFEGYFPKAYYDPVGVKTICYGITAGDLKADGASFSGVYTKEQCLQFLEKDLVRYQAEVRKCVPRVQPPHREAALISFAYNLGGGALCGPVGRNINAGNITAGCDAMLMYNHAGGRVLTGLSRRRAAERTMCLMSD